MEKIGLEAILKTDQFQQGLKIYLDGTLRMESETDRVARETAAATEQMAKKQAASLQKVGLAFSAVGAAGVALLTSITLTAARTEELGVILDVTAENARRLAEEQAQTAQANGDAAEAALALARASELSGRAVADQVQAVKELGITTQASSLLVAQMIRYNLDWKRATELAAVAQDAATFAAQDSSEALQGLIHGITTLNPRVLRTYGLLVNLEGAYSQWAEANGRTVDSLTQTEKVAIAFNQVLAQGPAIAGAYEAAMDTASKQIRSLKRDVMEVSEEFGTALTPALSGAVSALRDLLHWLRDLPDPIQATAVEVLAVAAGMVSLTGAAALVIPKLIALKTTLSDLAIVSQLASAGLLGPAGLVAGLVAVAGVAVLHAYNVEKAHQAEASAILLAADSYVAYMRNLRDAGLENYAMTESLYNLVKATEDATDATVALAQAQELLARQREIAPALAVYEKIPGGLEQWIEMVREGSRALDENLLLLYADANAMEQMALKAGASAEEARAFAEALAEIAEQEQRVREFLHAAEVGKEPWQEIAEETKKATAQTYEYNEALEDAAVNMEVMRQRRAKLAQAEAAWAEESAEAVRDAARDMVRAEQQADDQRETARRQLVDALGDLERAHAKRVADLLEQLAEVDIDLAADIVAAEEQAAQDRRKLAEDLARDLLAADKELAQDREDAARDLARDLEDMERELAQDREDAARDLAHDLEDLERELGEKLEAIREDHLQDMLALEKKYAERRQSLLESYAEKAQAIEEKYSLEPPPPDFDELRKALQEELRKLEEGGLTSMERQRRLHILEELDELKAEELALLEEQKAEELALLDEQLAEEQAAQEAAYQEQLSAAEQAHQQQKEERQRDYAERLDELERQHQREREERQRDYERRLDDLNRQHQREREAIQARYRQRLAELDAQLAEERKRLEQQAAEQKKRLQEQLAEEQANYAERKAELQRHYQDQLAEIEKSLAAEKAKIEQGLAEELREILAGLGDQTQAFRSAYEEQLQDLDQYLRDRLERERQYQQELEALYDIGSPSGWSKYIAQSIREGWQQGGGPSFATELGAALTGFQSSVNSLVPATPRMVMPAMPSMGGAVQNNRTDNFNLSVTAQYAKAQSEHSLRDDLDMYAMMMRARRR